MKKLIISFFVFHFSFFIFQFCGAQVIHVPGENNLTIQQGIELANPGNTILVVDGLYYENIDFLGKKPLVVASHFLIDNDTNHINNTIINGSQPVDPDFGSVVTFTSGEDTTSVLIGFTITGGTGTKIVSVGAMAGGGVFIQFSGAKLIRNHIEYNEVIHNGWAIGGGVCAGGPITPIPWVVLIENKIHHNQAISTTDDEGAGGGFEDYYNLIMLGNEVYNNLAKGSLRADGAGIRISGNYYSQIEVVIKENSVCNNRAESISLSTIDAIGGFDIAYNCSGIISNNIFTGNEIETINGPEGDAAGVFIQDMVSNDFLFEKNIISNNIATGGTCMGGGLCLWQTGGTYRNNIIKENSGTHGGGIYVFDNINKPAMLINNTITGNEAATGGGMHATEANLIIFNTIIAGNFSDEEPSIYREEGSKIEIRYSDIEGDTIWPGQGNINSDPEFLEDGWHIHENSPCEDTGMDSVQINFNWYYAPEDDFDGDIRPFHLGVDIGADESDVFEGLSGQSAVGSQQSAVITYPNPTGGIVDFRWSMVDFRWVSLKIFDVTGKEVAVVLEGKWPGDQVVRWDAGGLPAGVYYYRLTTNDQRLTTNTGKIVKY